MLCYPTGFANLTRYGILIRKHDRIPFFRPVEPALVIRWTCFFDSSWMLPPTSRSSRTYIRFTYLHRFMAFKRCRNQIFAHSKRLGVFWQPSSGWPLFSRLLLLMALRLVHYLIILRCCHVKWSETGTCGNRRFQGYFGQGGEYPLNQFEAIL
jgi:hypothetical protein